MPKRPHVPLAGKGSGSTYAAPSTTGSAPTATHVYASSLAVPDPSVSLARLQGQLTELAQQTTSFIQRNVTCRRIDDGDAARIALEQDGMYAPVRRARAEARLRLHFEKQQVDLRLYSRPAGKGPESMDVYNLVCVPLEGQVESRMRQASSPDALAEINAGANVWLQVVGAMGWEQDSELVRCGHRFVVRNDAACRVEVQLYQLYSLKESKLRRMSETYVVQATATLPLLVQSVPTLATNGETYTALDASKLSERAQAEIAAVQDALRDLLQFGKEEE